jgi:hypothetical protein
MVPTVIRSLVKVLGPRGVQVLSKNVGFVFFSECGVNGLGFIGFLATQLRGSPWWMAVADFLLLGTFGTLYKFEVDKDFLSFRVCVMFWRCSAKASWICVAASFNLFSMSSVCLPPGDGYSCLQNRPEICLAEDEFWDTSRGILSPATGLEGQEEIS